jgi:hypothetical protein
LVIIFLVFAFAGVQPFASYKDATLGYITNLSEKVTGLFKGQEKSSTGPSSTQENGAIGKTDKPQMDLAALENEVVTFINSARQSRKWAILTRDEALVKYAKEHSQSMAQKGEVFFSPIDMPYIEACWKGDTDTSHMPPISKVINDYIVTSKIGILLLYPDLKHIGVGITISDGIVYTTCTFWKDEIAESDWLYIHGLPPIPQN